jgi:hypothetical protein
MSIKDVKGDFYVLDVWSVGFDVLAGEVGRFKSTSTAFHNCETVFDPFTIAVREVRKYLVDYAGRSFFFSVAANTCG